METIGSTAQARARGRGRRFSLGRGRFYSAWAKSVTASTEAQHAPETSNSPAPRHASAMPTRRAMAPAAGTPVAPRIAGNVMTASVTYGT